VLRVPRSSSSARALGSAPCEVLGSTETGGIAWRVQSEGDPESAWTPFPRARVEARDGLLHVRSPQSDLEHGVTTGDAIELATGGRFLLRGRADRIVKLFDERNQQIAAKIEPLLKSNEPAFVVVGAGHLIGKNGILKLLEKEGYFVEQVTRGGAVVADATKPAGAQAGGATAAAPATAPPAEGEKKPPKRGYAPADAWAK